MVGIHKLCEVQKGEGDKGWRSEIFKCSCARKGEDKKTRLKNVENEICKGFCALKGEEKKKSTSNKEKEKSPGKIANNKGNASKIPLTKQVS